MSVRATTWAWEQQIPPNGKILLVALADHAHDNGENSWPSVATLCTKTGLSRSTVQRLLTSLLNEGIISVQRAGGVDGKTPTVYALNIEESFAVSKRDFNQSFCPPGLRAEVIVRDRFTCQLDCERVGTEEADPDGNAWEIDRVEAGGRYVSENVRLACRACNRARWSHRQGPQHEAPEPEGGGLMDQPGGASSVRPEPRTKPTTTTTPTTSTSTEIGHARGGVKGKMTSSWWPTSEASQTALTRYPSIKHRRETETFRDWHIASDTTARTRDQWDALWLTWCARKQTDAEPRPEQAEKFDEVTGLPVRPHVAPTITKPPEWWSYYHTLDPELPPTKRLVMTDNHFKRED